MGALYAFELQEFIDKYNVKIYFETGTGEGISLKHALRYQFDELYSVDIDKELIRRSLVLKQKRKNLRLISGKSTEVIEKYVPQIDDSSPVLFFLDAHFPGADFHKISYEQSIRHFKQDAFPLEEEVNAILRDRDVSKDVFIIDDFMLYEDGDYDSIKEGVVWKYGWLQEEMNLETSSSFLYDLFKDTHDLKKDLRHQGYMIMVPKGDK